MEASSNFNMVSGTILRKMHHEDRLSSIKIAKVYGVSDRTIRYWLKKQNIENIGNTFQKGSINLKNKVKAPDKIKFFSMVNLGRSPVNKFSGHKEFKCIVCNDIHYDKPYRRKKYCSKECRDKSKGVTHWRFKGKETRGNQTRRNWKEAIDFRKSVHERDNYKCRICGNKSKQTHHIFGWAENETLRYDKNNGIAVCIPCHKQIHKLCGRNNYTYLSFKNKYHLDSESNRWVLVTF